MEGVCVTCISELWNRTPEAINMLAMKQHTTEAGQHWNEWQAQMVYSQIPAQKRKYLGLIFHHLFQNISLSANLFLHTKSLKSVAGGTDFQQTNQHHTCFKKYLCNYCHVNHKHMSNAVIVMPFRICNIFFSPVTLYQHWLEMSQKNLGKRTQ